MSYHEFAVIKQLVGTLDGPDGQQIEGVLRGIANLDSIGHQQFLATLTRDLVKANFPDATRIALKLDSERKSILV